MSKTKPDIKEFDNLSITDLMSITTKELVVAIYIKVKQQNGKLELHTDKLKWHDRFIWGVISTIGLGVMTAIIIGVINVFYF